MLNTHFEVHDPSWGNDSWLDSAEDLTTAATKARELERDSIHEEVEILEVVAGGSREGWMLRMTRIVPRDLWSE